MGGKGQDGSDGQRDGGRLVEGERGFWEIWPVKNHY